MFNSASTSVENIKKLIEATVKSSMPSGIYFGTVTSENPLTVLVEQKITLTDKQLILSRNVTDFETEISFDNPDTAQPLTIKNLTVSGAIKENGATEQKEIDQLKADIKCSANYSEKVKHKVTVYNALKHGDMVILFRVQGGQKYIVSDRVVAL